MHHGNMVVKSLIGKVFRTVCGRGMREMGEEGEEERGGVGGRVGSRGKRGRRGRRERRGRRRERRRGGRRKEGGRGGSRGNGGERGDGGGRGRRREDGDVRYKVTCCNHQLIVITFPHIAIQQTLWQRNSFMVCCHTMPSLTQFMHRRISVDKRLRIRNLTKIQIFENLVPHCKQSKLEG